MTDGESVVSQSSAIMDHEYPAYVSHDYNDGNKNAAAGSVVASVEKLGDVATDPAKAGGDLNYGSFGGVEDGRNAVVDGSDIVATAAYDNDKLPDLESGLAETSQAIGSDTHLNADVANQMGGVTTSTVDENGIKEGVHGSSAFHQPVNGSALSAEEKRLWSIVRANACDFNSWTALIDETEKMSEGDITRIRKVYDSFLAEFPLCYGYWKKYADHEARIGSMDRVVAVYEQAVQAVTYSVDMWLHYCVFAMGTYGDTETIRRLFERGLAYVGTDYLSFPLWDKYIEFEYTHRDWSRVALLYTRVLQNPTQQLDRYFEGFKELVASWPLSELRTEDEVATATVVDSGDPNTEGEANTNSVEQSKPVSASLNDAEELEKYIAIREEIYKKAKEFDSKIIGFETAIRRPYFHVRPQNIAELENWHNYLNFIEGVGDLNKVVKLYERCLIACANYPEYWIRYVLFMKASGSMDLAENALARATQVFVKRQPEIHLFAARFREQHGNFDVARASYQLVHTEISPGLLEAIIKHSNMERRLGNLEDACSLYEQAIAIEKGKEHSQTLPLLYAQHARFLHLVSGKVEQSREILDQAVENIPLSKPLLEALIHLESVQPLPKRLEYLESLVDKFVVGSPDNPNVASISEREELSSIFLEFLDLFGDAQSIEKADARHAKLFLPHRGTSESKKRHAEDYLNSDRAKLAKSALPSVAPSVTGTYPNAQNQWPAGYGMAQGWPQVAQSQAQQWTPTNTQQAAYGAYATYGSTYPQPQIAASALQAAAAYPPPYPAQAYTQQTYGQVATPTATVQQPAAVPPTAYYGSYY